MEVLKLSQICGYLPHRLMVAEISSGACDISACHLFQGIFTLDICNKLGEGWVDEGNYDLRHIVPILRPISDMEKPITHNGKEIVPIVELAKIAFPKCEWEFAEKEKINAATTVYNNTYQLFMYDFYSGFKFRYGSGISDVQNQHQLFDYLNQLKIDYRGLIDSGLAVSVYDLEINPYK